MHKSIPLLFCVLAIAGCQPRLQDVSVVNIEPGTQKFKMVEAVSMEQTIKISGTATAGKFNVHVYLQRDQAEVERDLAVGRRSQKLLADKLGATQAEVSALIPANQVTVIMLTSGDGGKAVVNLKISN